MRMKKIFAFVLATVMMLSMAISASADSFTSNRVYICENDANGQPTTKKVAVATYRIDYFLGTNCVRASSTVTYLNLDQSQYNFPAYIDLSVSVVSGSTEGDYSQTNIGYITTQNGSVWVDIYIPLGAVIGTAEASFETNTRRTTADGTLYYGNSNFTAVSDDLSLNIP